MADFKNFNPSLYVVTFGGILVRGFAADTHIQVARNEDSFTESVGAQGDVVRTRSNNKSGIVTVTLQAESPTNDQFSARLLADELSPAGIPAGALLVKYLNGATFISSDKAYLRKFSDVEVGTEAGNREWIVSCAELNMFVGGALV